jgi:hypothetical protein
MKIERFDGIETWQLARELTRKVYDLTKKSKVAQDFGLYGKPQCRIKSQAIPCKSLWSKDYSAIVGIFRTKLFAASCHSRSGANPVFLCRRGIPLERE